MVMHVKVTSWRFLAAKVVDYALLLSGMGVVTSFLPYFIDFQTYCLLALATPFMMIPIEAFNLRTFGTTPGKALFGTRTSKKLSWTEAFRSALFLNPKTENVEDKKPLSMTRRLTGLFLGAACVALSFFGNTFSQWTLGLGKGVSTEGWTLYASDKGFTVQLPGEPSKEHRIIEIPAANKTLDYHALKSYQNKHVHYGVSHVDLPKQWKLAGPSRLLKTALDSTLGVAPGAKILGKRFTTHQGYKALDFVLKHGDEEVRGRLILVGTRLYALSIAYPADANIDFSDNHFMDSFDVKK